MIFCCRKYKNIKYARTVDNNPGPGGAGERGLCCGGAGEQLPSQQVSLGNVKNVIEFLLIHFLFFIRLEGNWTFNPTMSELLSGDSKAGGFLGQMIVGFSNQSEVTITL